MLGAYQRDLAYIHDVGFTGLASSALGTVLGLLRKGGPRGLVIDVGCGTGVLANGLVEAGLDVLGIDVSPAMIAIARKKAPGAVFKVGSLYDATLPRCRAVTAIGECLNYAFDGKGDEKRLVRWFRRVHRALEPGGILVFDIAEPGQVRTKSDERRHVQGDDWAVLVDVKETTRPSRLIRTINSYRRVGRRYRRTTEVHVLDLYRGKTVVELLRARGFTVRVARGYGKFPLAKAHVVVIAQKRGDHREGA